jgi:flagellar motor switch protein FliG
MHNIRTVTVAPYLRDEHAIIAHAFAIMESRLRKSGEVLNLPELAKNLFVLRLADLEQTVSFAEKGLL